MLPSVAYNLQCLISFPKNCTRSYPHMFILSYKADCSSGHFHGLIAVSRPAADWHRGPGGPTPDWPRAAFHEVPSLIADWSRGLPFMWPCPSPLISGEGQGCTKGSPLSQSAAEGRGRQHFIFSKFFSLSDSMQTRKIVIQVDSYTYYVNTCTLLPHFYNTSLLAYILIIQES